MLHASLNGLSIAFAAFGAATSTALSAESTVQCEVQKLTASDAGWSHRFGRSVSVSGNVAVVTAASHPCAAGPACGAAYVYRFDGLSWMEEQKLSASDEVEDKSFGASASVDGNVILIGAPGAQCTLGGRCGASYIYRFDGSTWIREQELTPSDPGADDGFGVFVSLSGNVAVISAFRRNCPAGPDCGAAYIFRFDGGKWVEEQELIAPDASADDQFGRSVAVSGDVALIGALNPDCAAGRNCGATYVFELDGSVWIQKQKLIASDTVQADHFGISVSIDGDVAVIGASGVDCQPAPNADCGAVYVYRFDGSNWVEEQKLISAIPRRWTGFGARVALSSDTAIVTAASEGSPSGALSGAAYVFRFTGTTWSEELKLTASDRDRADLFGVAVAIDGDNVIVGAVGDACSGRSGTYCGAAYVFAFGPDCNDNGIPDGCDDDGDLDGVPDECDLCPDTNLGDTITIGDCDTGVVNGIFDDGCSMGQRLEACMADGRNHGDAVSCVRRLAGAWMREGTITGREHGMITACTARAKMGRPNLSGVRERGVRSRDKP